MHFYIEIVNNIVLLRSKIIDKIKCVHTLYVGIKLPTSKNV